MKANRKLPVMGSINGTKEERKPSVRYGKTKALVYMVLLAIFLSLLSACVVYPVGYHRHWHEDHHEHDHWDH